MEWLDITTPIYRSSELNISGKSSELIINICKKLDASHYISGFGGENYLDEDYFIKNNIKLEYLENRKIIEYSQLYHDKGFLDDLSALDIVFNCGNKWIDYLV